MKSWDVCPECGARRIAYCRFCNTIGDHFPLAELDLILPQEDDEMYDDGAFTPDAVKSFLAGNIGSAMAGNIGTALAGGTFANSVYTTDTISVGNQQNAHGGANGGHFGCCENGHAHGHAHGGHSCRCSQPQTPQTPGKGRPDYRLMVSELSQPLDMDPELDPYTDEYPLAVMCPCCDELLYPQFLKECRSCGHVFEDGITLEDPSAAHFHDPSKDPKVEIIEDESDDDYGPEDGHPGKPGSGCCLMLIAAGLGVLWLV